MTMDSTYVPQARASFPLPSKRDAVRNGGRHNATYSAAHTPCALRLRDSNSCNRPGSGLYRLTDWNIWNTCTHHPFAPFRPSNRRRTLMVERAPSLCPGRR
jgi:hypothetical protein